MEHIQTPPSDPASATALQELLRQLTVRDATIARLEAELRLGGGTAHSVHAPAVANADTAELNVEPLVPLASMQIFWPDATGVHSETRCLNAAMVADGIPREINVELPPEAGGLLRIDPDIRPIVWEIEEIAVFVDGRSAVPLLRWTPQALEQGGGILDGLALLARPHALGAGIALVGWNKDPQLLIPFPPRVPGTAWTLRIKSTIQTVESFARTASAAELIAVMRDHALLQRQLEEQREARQSLVAAMAEVSARLDHIQAVEAATLQNLAAMVQNIGVQIADMRIPLWRRIKRKTARWWGGVKPGA